MAPLRAVRRDCCALSKSYCWVKCFRYFPCCGDLMFSPLPAACADLFDPVNQALLVSRRQVLGLLAITPIVVASPPAVASPDHLVVHQGWVLRATDVERLGLK